MAALKTALEGEDVEGIKTRTNELVQASMKLGEAMYAAQQGSANDTGAEPSEPGVVDAEFEEVSDEKKSA